jgi:hypothetical protein
MVFCSLSKVTVYGGLSALVYCLWDGGDPGDDRPDPHGRAGREWSGGTDPGIGGTEAMDIMWRWFQWSVGNTD